MREWVVVGRVGVGGGRACGSGWWPSSCGGSWAVTVVVVGEGVEVVGDGARWSEVGRGVVVVVMGEGLGMGWLSEVREVGWGGVVVVVIRGGG
jgi:hypothetical protein